MTQDLTNIDRAAIYLNLLELYAASEDVDKALGLWTQMQEVRTRPVMLPLAATHVSSQGRSGPRTPEYKAKKSRPRRDSSLGHMFQKRVYYTCSTFTSR